MGRFDRLLEKEPVKLVSEKTETVEPTLSLKNQESVVVRRLLRTNESFLHNHPEFERDFKVGGDHVIIDRVDWERARIMLAGQRRVISRARLDSSSSSFLPNSSFQRPGFII